MRSHLLKPIYNRVVQKGLPGLGTPQDVAQRTSPNGTPGAATDRIIALYTSLGGATGFVSGLPGFLLLPITLPANLLGVAAIQLHMAAAFAVLGGRDLHDPETRDDCIACLLEKVNESAKNSEDEEVAKRTGIKLAERGVRFVAEQAVRTAKWTAKRVAFRQVGRRMPLLGGVIGAGTDAYFTRHVGQCAARTFLGEV